VKGLNIFTGRGRISGPSTAGLGLLFLLGRVAAGWAKCSWSSASAGASPVGEGAGLLTSSAHAKLATVTAPEDGAEEAAGVVRPESGAPLLMVAVEEELPLARSSSSGPGSGEPEPRGADWWICAWRSASASSAPAA